MICRMMTACHPIILLARGGMREGLKSKNRGPSTHVQNEFAKKEYIQIKDSLSMNLFRYDGSMLMKNGTGKKIPVSYTHLTLPTTPYV